MNKVLNRLLDEYRKTNNATVRIAVSSDVMEASKIVRLKFKGYVVSYAEVQNNDQAFWECILTPQAIAMAAENKTATISKAPSVCLTISIILGVIHTFLFWLLQVFLEGTTVDGVTGLYASDINIIETALLACFGVNIGLLISWIVCRKATSKETVSVSQKACFVIFLISVIGYALCLVGYNQFS